MIKPKILIVDDSPIILQLLTGIFSKDYEVVTYTSGAKAFKDLPVINPDVVILDNDLREAVEGIQLLEMIKDSDFLSYLPVVMLSGEQSTAFKVRCLQAGAEEVLSKPFNPQELLVRVDRAISVPTALAS